MSFYKLTCKLTCVDKGKGMDGNVLLRDELKVCAQKKMSHNLDNVD